MADTTNIEWADSTWNPWIGCSAVSPGCDNCYAADWAKRYGRDFSERTKTADWAKPKRWNAAPFFQCSSCGKRGDGLQFGLGGQGQATPLCPSCTSHDILPARRRVFPSLCDPFDNQVPEVWRAQLFALIMETPNIDWLLLTKRIGYAHKLIGGFHSVPLLPNIWLGAAIVNQAEADRDIPKLLDIPARVRFLSMEPLLGPVNLTRLPHEDGGSGDALAGEVWVETWLDDAGTQRQRCAVGEYGRLDWVIVGGESGPNARPMSPEWARSLRDQCRAAGVPYLFKQWGEWIPMLGQAEGLPVRNKIAMPDGWVMGFAGKKATGRLLDGQLHDAWPS